MKALITGSLLLSLVGFGAFSAQAQTYTITDSKTIFMAKGKPGFLKIEGKNAIIKGEMKRTGETWLGSMQADLSKLETGIDLRDQHMHEKYLETKKYPSAFLKISSVRVEGDSCEFDGTLELKKVAKAVTGTCEIEKLTPDTLVANVAFEFDLKDYTIGVPSYLGITVASSVKITSSFSAKASKATH